MIRGRSVGAGLAAFVLVSLVGAGGPAAAADPENCLAAKTTGIVESSEPLRKLNAAEANAVAKGRGVIVAVVDSGVDATNPHLKGVVLPGKSFLAKDKSQGRVDTYGHGTVIAGVIAARKIPGSGLIGLAPEAKILPVRVFASPALIGNEVETSTSTATAKSAAANLPRLDRVAAGIRWAADNGAQVVNVSISTPVEDPALKSAVAYANSKGALVVASVGNRTNQGNLKDTRVLPDQVRYPAGFDGVLGVTAADTATGRVTDQTVYGEHVDVSAPGTNVLSTFSGRDCILAVGLPSTSFATAYGSGAVALLRQHFPRASISDLTLRLERTASSAVTRARDDVSGWGLIDPAAALTASAAGLADPGAARASLNGPALVSEAIPDPRADARRDTLWWSLLGVAGLVLAGVVGLLRPPARRS